MLDWISQLPGSQMVMSTTKSVVGRILQTGPVPQHIGFVMDGNRRFARQRNIELKEGHSAGFESMARVLEMCYECGVKSATVFAFSIENFKRSRHEVDWLMELAKGRFQQLTESGEMAEKYGVRIKVLGDTSLLPKDVQVSLREAEDITKNNTRATLNVCFPYTSRHEMAHAMRTIVKSTAKGTIQLDDINTQLVDECLYTGGQPPVDLLIRTSGVSRLSDFLLWQVSSKGCMIEFVDTLWPELTVVHILWILIKFSFNKMTSKKQLEQQQSQQLTSQQQTSQDSKKLI
ncbi:Dehydrodolichyl diphosphate syntase complex subunit RER2 [Cyberlindnera fabianii]|uniref:Alkyl transferase n=1 Tax=Cyberlindnera fabianii TaxID=36022 RepID=A0A1V2L6E0_CYBFA|nr:Dehydrodolichyl diphosphate syntase complex subunit RER2 [Cyberlindnera fabianii]